MPYPSGMKTILASIVFLALTGCGVARGLIQHPDASSAPPGCVWVVREAAPGYDKSLYLCCAAEPNAIPICREASWGE